MTLNAGAAAHQISPPRGAALFGYPHVKRTSTGVHDPLLASALFLEDDSLDTHIWLVDRTAGDVLERRANPRRWSNGNFVDGFKMWANTHLGSLALRARSQA